VPNLPTHIDLARQAADRLGHPALAPYVGYFLLGSTSPDVRAMAHGRREDYHFAPLSFREVGAGIKGLFDAHPRLVTSSECNGPTRAFVAGYITHLVLDESWIVEIYRPYFGNPTVFHDEAYGKVMDRALQLELDRQSHGGVEAALPLLAQARNGVDVGFISRQTLGDWHRWVLEFVAREFTWDRLRFMAGRIAAGDVGHPAHRLAGEFLGSMPGSLDDLQRHVSNVDLAGFRERSVVQIAGAVEDYLS